MRILTALCAIIIVFVSVSILDVVIGLLYTRFYTGLAFIVTFGVGDIFASVFSFEYGMNSFSKKNKNDRWSLILLQILTGLASFFLLARLEGGKYEAAFKSFGAALALGSLLFIKKF